MSKITNSIEVKLDQHITEEVHCQRTKPSETQVQFWNLKKIILLCADFVKQTQRMLRWMMWMQSTGRTIIVMQD